VKLKGQRVGFALTGSFCTFDTAFAVLEKIVSEGAIVTPIISSIVDTTDTRFIKASDLKEKLYLLTGSPIIKTIAQAEPIGPQQLLDLLIILPCTGNTMAKLACGITDTAVCMAAKSHLRNNRPVVLGLSTNDALGNSAKNIGILLNTRNYYFVPFGQDDPFQKNRSMVLNGEHALQAFEMALDGQQLQPILT
jgi:dipicolinate synthase subunit B